MFSFWKNNIPSPPPPKIPASKAVLVPQMPDWTPEFDKGEGPIVPFHQSLFLDYTSYGGEASSRRITTRSLRRWNRDDLAVWAWCHEREAPRTFLASRVDNLTDAETGEFYDPPEDWLHEQYEEWPEIKAETGRKHAELAQAVAEQQARTAAREVEAQAKRDATERLRFARTAVLSLVYVAKADGRMDAAERNVIAAFIRQLSNDHDVDLDWSDVHGRLRKLVCDQQEFLGGLKRLRDGPQDLRTALLAAARGLMLADGEAHQDERRAVAWLAVMLKV